MLHAHPPYPCGKDLFSMISGEPQITPQIYCSKRILTVDRMLTMFVIATPQQCTFPPPPRGLLIRIYVHIGRSLNPIPPLPKLSDQRLASDNSQRKATISRRRDRTAFPLCFRKTRRSFVFTRKKTKPGYGEGRKEGSSFL